MGKGGGGGVAGGLVAGVESGVEGAGDGEEEWMEIVLRRAIIVGVAERDLLGGGGGAGKVVCGLVNEGGAVGVLFWGGREGIGAGFSLATGGGGGAGEEFCGFATEGEVTAGVLFGGGGEGIVAGFSFETGGGGGGVKSGGAGEEVFGWIGGAKRDSGLGGGVETE